MKRASRCMPAVVLCVVFGGQFGVAGGAVLSTASLTLSDSRPSAASSYDFLASGVTTSTIKCVRLAFNTAADGSGSKPSGLDVTGAALSGTSNYMPTPGSWSVSNNNTTGVVSLTYGSGEAPASASARHVVVTGVTNGSTSATTYFLLVNTYNSTDCATSPVDSAVAAFVYTDGQAVSLTVDPSLTFTVAGTSSGTACNGATTNQATTASTIPLGRPTGSTNRIGAQNLTVATNAGGGYTVTTRYTAKPTSGTNTIADHGGTNASPSAFSAAGTEAFGYTTNDATLGTGTANRFTNGGPKWAAFTTTNAEVAYSSAAVASDVTCVGYQVGISPTTPAGTYTTTVIFTATPIF